MSSVQDPRPAAGRRIRQSVLAGTITALLVWRVLAGDWSAVPGLAANIALLMVALHLALHGVIVTLLRSLGARSASALADYLHPHTLNQRDLAVVWLAVYLVARHL